MGLFKKKQDDGEDHARSSLFSKSKKEKDAPAPSTSNPYANVPPDPYTQAKMKAGLIQPPQGQAAPPQGYNDNKYGAPGGQQGSYGQDNKYGPPGGPPQSQGGYAPNRYGDDKGYGGPNPGSNPYGAPAPPRGGNPYAAMNQASAPPRAAGGYGGLSGPDDKLDENRNALFGGAQQRVPQQNAGGLPGYQYNGTGDNNGNPTEPRNYGAYGDRQLTAEEEEDEDVTATKQEIRFMKQADVSSTRNALQAAAMAEETGRNTLARLGAQGERIHNTSRNLDMGYNAMNVAEDRSKEIKQLNRSMFAVHVNNPFTAGDRRVKDEEKIMARHQQERDQREATREQAFQSTQRMNQNFKGLGEAGRPPGMQKASLAERSKYQFEADSDDDRMEDEIERNIDDLGGAAKRLNILARAMGDEADSQNKMLQNVADKSDKLDDRLHLQTERLKKIH